MKLQFKLELIQHIKSNPLLSKSEKRKVIRAVLFKPMAFEYAVSEFEDLAYEKGLEIDFEDFDWEAFADALVKIIEAVAKIILAVI